MPNSTDSKEKTMNCSLNPLQLGASLYVPATHPDLAAIAGGHKLRQARSVIFCLEDSVSEADLPGALNHLDRVLGSLQRKGAQMLFVRPRNAQVLGRVLDMRGAGKLDGFVVPKATAASLPAYVAELDAHPATSKGQMLMPTLETREAFDAQAMNELHAYLVEPAVRARILSLRIGGNDLLNVLGLRRSRHRTVYESPLGLTISQLVARFKPSGFNLTSPVCEHLDDYEVLDRELVQDLEYGLFGKTAIHPDQVPVIEKAYQPSEQDYKTALAILAPGAPAVFRMFGSMCEVATHTAWAQAMLARAETYGVFGKSSENLKPLRAA